jgi:hypothetical protein
MAEFTSRLNEVCNHALEQIFSTLEDSTPETSGEIAQFLTKDSLVAYAFTESLRYRIAEYISLT